MVSARIVTKGSDIITFECPKCNRRYAAPSYTKDFVCAHCYRIPYRFNYETKSREYKIWKDTYLTLE